MPTVTWNQDQHTFPRLSQRTHFSDGIEETEGNCSNAEPRRTYSRIEQATTDAEEDPSIDGEGETKRQRDV